MAYDSDKTNIDEIESAWQDICFFTEPRNWFYYNMAHRSEKKEA